MVADGKGTYPQSGAPKSRLPPGAIPQGRNVPGMEKDALPSATDPGAREYGND